MKTDSKPGGLPQILQVSTLRSLLLSAGSYENMIQGK